MRTITSKPDREAVLQRIKSAATYGACLWESLRRGLPPNVDPGKIVELQKLSEEYDRATRVAASVSGCLSDLRHNGVLVRSGIIPDPNRVARDAMKRLESRIPDLSDFRSYLLALSQRIAEERETLREEIADELLRLWDITADAKTVKAMRQAARLGVAER